MIQSIKIDKEFKDSENLIDLLTFKDEKSIHRPEDMNRYILSRFFGNSILSKLKQLDFKDGINLIYAPNGSGKSTILDLISIMFHSRQNYSSYITNNSSHNVVAKICELPIMTSTKIKLDILKLVNIVHDGLSVHYFDPTHMVGLSHEGHEFDHDFNFKKGAPTKNGSSGQQILMRLEQFFDNTDTEIIFKKSKEDIEASWQGEFNIPFLEGMLKPTIPKGPVTYLLDEPTRSLDIIQEAKFWDKIDSMRDKQIIIATHSPFGLFMKDVNYIELEPGYVEKCKNTLKKNIDFIKK
jgi:predicted ATPase